MKTKPKIDLVANAEWSQDLISGLFSVKFVFKRFTVGFEAKRSALKQIDTHVWAEELYNQALIYLMDHRALSVKNMQKTLKQAKKEAEKSNNFGISEIFDGEVAHNNKKGRKCK